MKKILLLLLLSSGLVFADDHGMEKDTYYAFFGIAANNPPAVVAAMDKFNASDCGQASPSSVALMGEAFNGNEPSTHTFVVTYEGAEEIDETLSIINACPEYAEFLTEMAAVSVPTEQILNKVVYIRCKSEHELLSKFLKFWSDNFPNVVTGWNVAGFDMPYLFNRLTNLGFDANKLSPWNRCDIREIQLRKENNQQQKFKEVTIKGVPIIDYIILYRKIIICLYVNWIITII